MIKNTMSNKQRKFKSSEDTSRYWSGSQNKSVSTMKNCILNMHQRHMINFI